MTKRKNSANYFYFIGILSLLLSVFLAGRALAIGQITEPIDIKDALRGQAVTATLTLLNSEDKEVTYELKAEGQIVDWASFYKIDDKKLASPITRLQIPAKSYIDATVEFSVPGDAPNGEYTGVVAVLSVPEELKDTSESSSNVSQRVDREVTITVSDKEVIDFDVSVIPAKYDMEEKEPLKIRIIYDNRGNISLDPQVQVKIKQNDQTFFNAIFPYPESETAVKPGTLQEIPALEIPTTNLANGKYTAELEFLYKGASRLKKDFSFSTGAAAAGQVLGAATVFDNLKNNWWLVTLGVVIILAIIFGLIFFRHPKSKK